MVFKEAAFAAFILCQKVSSKMRKKFVAGRKKDFSEKKISDCFIERNISKKIGWDFFVRSNHPPSPHE